MSNQEISSVELLSFLLHLSILALHPLLRMVGFPSVAGVRCLCPGSKLELIADFRLRIQIDDSEAKARNLSD